MKTLLIGCLLSLLVACDDAIVISFDGKTELGYCPTLANKARCFNKVCPSGIIGLKNDGASSDTSIVRCLNENVR